MFRGSNWARWLTVVWIAYHPILSGFDSGSARRTALGLRICSLSPRCDEILSPGENGAAVGNDLMILLSIPNHGLNRPISARVRVSF